MKTAPDIPQTLTEFIYHTHLCVEVRNVVQEEAMHNCALIIEKSFIKATENAHYYPFQSSYDGENDVIKNGRFFLMENVLTEMNHRGTLQNMVERSVEKWTKPSTFVEAFTSSVLRWNQFVRIAEK